MFDNYYTSHCNLGQWETHRQNTYHWLVGLLACSEDWVLTVICPAAPRQTHGGSGPSVYRRSTWRWYWLWRDRTEKAADAPPACCKGGPGAVAVSALMETLARKKNEQNFVTRGPLTSSLPEPQSCLFVFRPRCQSLKHAFHTVTPWPSSGGRICESDPFVSIV